MKVTSAGEPVEILITQSNTVCLIRWKLRCSLPFISINFNTARGPIHRGRAATPSGNFHSRLLPWKEARILPLVVSFRFPIPNKRDGEKLKKSLLIVVKSPTWECRRHSQQPIRPSSHQDVMRRGLAYGIYSWIEFTIYLTVDCPGSRH